MDRKPMKQFGCIDCKINTLVNREYYMVHNKIWKKVNPKIKGMLCIGCLERRLGRLLNRNDFTDAPVNRGFFGVSDLSKRLINRLQRG